MIDLFLNQVCGLLIDTLIDDLTTSRGFLRENIINQYRCVTDKIIRLWTKGCSFQWQIYQFISYKIVVLLPVILAVLHSTHLSKQDQFSHE